MQIIYFLILVSLAVAVVFLLAFIWAVKDGQYHDDYSPSVRMLYDEGKKKVVVQDEKEKIDIIDDSPKPK